LLCRQAVGHLVSEVVAGRYNDGWALVDAATKSSHHFTGSDKEYVYTKLKVASVVRSTRCHGRRWRPVISTLYECYIEGAASRAKSQNVQLCAQHCGRSLWLFISFLPEHDNLFPLQADDYKKALLPYTDTSIVFTCPDDVSSRKRRTRDNQSSFPSIVIWRELASRR
jgi:hypothetical protein